MKKIYSLLFAFIALLSVSQAYAQSDYTVVKSWDFSTLGNKEAMTYSSETVTIDVACDVGTDFFEGLAAQGASNWFGYTYGLYNGNGGSRTFAVLDLTAGERVTVIAGTGGELNLLTSEVATLSSDEVLDDYSTTYVFDITADGNLGFKFNRYYEILSIVIEEQSAESSSEELSYVLDFNTLDLATSSGSSTDGDITEETPFTTEGFTVTVSPKDESVSSTNNRIWSSTSGPQLRMYSGTLTVSAVDGKVLNKIVFDASSSNFNLTPDAGTLDGMTWTSEEGEATVVFTCGSNTQINSITATISDMPLAEATDIGEFLALEDGTEAQLALVNAKVTFVSSDGQYAFIEDASGALMLYNIGLDLTAGTALNGFMTGKFTVSDDIPQMVSTSNTASSEFTPEPTELVPTEMTVEQIAENEGINKLVKLSGVTIEYLWDDLYAITSESGGVTFSIDITDKFGVLSEGYTYPTLADVVAIGGTAAVYPVSEDSIVEATVTMTVAENIAAMKALENGTDVKLILNDTKITLNYTSMRGTQTIIIEDASGAVQVVTDSWGMGDIPTLFPEAFASDSIALNGYLYGTYVNEWGVVGIQMNDSTAYSEISYEATDLTPTVMTIAEAATEENDLRFVQFQNVWITYDESSWTYYIKQGEDSIVLSDSYLMMPEDDEYNMIIPDYAININGIVMDTGDYFQLVPLGNPPYTEATEEGGSDETGEATATLVHTASAVWGSNSGPNTVDNETEYYNNDAASSWAAVAYAEFSLSIPEGSSVTGATLTYSVNQGGNYTRNDIIYYMNAGFTLDYDYLLESTGTDLRYTDSRTVAVESAPTGGTGDRLNLTQDVTAAVQAIVNAGQDYIIFQWTGNAAGCQLYGKASEYAPTLTITTASADEMTTYTVRFVDEEGSELKSDVSYAVVIGETATASDDDMASFYSEDGTIKYIYVSGNDTITASEDAESNVITLTFREADTYSYTVYTVVGSETYEVVTGSDFEGETVYFTYPKYYNLDGTLYSIAQQTSGSGYTSAGYHKGSFTLTEDGQVVAVDGYSPDVTDVVFYSEAEDIEGLTAFSDNNADIRCSDGTAAYNAGEEPVVITTLTPGTYILYSAVWGNSGTEFLFQAGDVDLLSLTTVGYLLTGNSGEFTLDANTDITLNTQTTTGRGIDYVYIVKTSEEGGVATGISEVNTGVENANGNVYTINGVMVRKAGDSLDGLAKGLYIIDGKKVVIK